MLREAIRKENNLLKMKTGEYLLSMQCKYILARRNNTYSS